MADDRHWSLDKRIPLALIVTMLVQFGGGVWFAAQLQAQVAANARDTARHEDQIKALQTGAQRLEVHLARIETGIDAIRNDLARVARALEGNN